MNLAIIKGVSARTPDVHAIPGGSTVVSFEITVPAMGGRRAESVPVVWIDAPPSAAAIEPDTEVVVIGRVRRRFFRAGGGGGTQNRTEVVADIIVPARQAKRAGRLVLAALGAAEEEMQQ